MALVNSSRNNGRGKRKKKTNLSHKKKHNSTTRQTYFKYYHQTKKLNKLLDENKCQIQNEQIAKRKAHAKVKANIEKTIAQRMNQTRRTLNRHASALSDVTLDSNKRGRKRQITDMFNVETEIDEHEYEAMENEINAQTDNDVIMWNGDENTNTHPRTQPLRRSSRKKKNRRL
eukprot:364427_1